MYCFLFNYASFCGSFSPKVYFFLRFGDFAYSIHHHNASSSTAHSDMTIVCTPESPKKKAPKDYRRR